MSELHVVFGTGPLGKWTARALVNMGRRVRMINRSGRGDGLPTGVEIVAGDAYDVSRNIEQTRGATAVYQCAQPHYYEWSEKFPPLQAAILEAAARNGAKLIVGDNLYMYGDGGGQPITEASPLSAQTRKGRIRAAMAETVLAAHRAGRVRAAIGRASDFFGPDDEALTGYALRPALEGKAVNLMGNVDQPHTFTYVADFGKALAYLGTHDDALGQVWFAPSPEPVTQRQFVALLEEEMGRPVKMMVGGPLILRVMGLFNREINETVEMLYEWTQPYVVDTRKFTQHFGVPPTPLPQAIRETVAWLKAGSRSNGHHA